MANHLGLVILLNVAELPKRVQMVEHLELQKALNFSKPMVLGLATKLTMRKELVTQLA